MTPTNDAPVTVEPQDMKAARQFVSDEWPSWDHDSQTVTAELAVRFAVHRLAAFASAPAGDGVEMARAVMVERMRAIQREEPKSGFDRMADDLLHGRLMHVQTWLALDLLAAALARPHSAVAPAGDGVEALAKAASLAVADAAYHLKKYRPHVLAALEEALATHDAAALALPRAAVGEREDICAVIEGMTRADWDSWVKYTEAHKIHAPKVALVREKADRILALQAPPAKVEG